MKTDSFGLGIKTVLSVENLSIGFQNREKSPLVQGLCFSLKKGEILGIAGESGSGKTLMACALSGLLPPPLCVLSGSVCFSGKAVHLNAVTPSFNRGGDLLFLFQSPSSALDPTAPVGSQISHALRAHERCSRKASDLKALSMMERVGLAADVFNRYPFQLSGGQRQRVLLALAFGLRPRVLIADEPTAGLDDENRDIILELLSRLRNETGTAALIISHDLRVLSRLGQRISVLYRGHQVETGPVLEIINHPVHDHTRELVAAMRYLEDRQ